MDLTPENVNGVNNDIHKSAKDANNSNDICISHFSKMAAVDIEFNDVTYSVPSTRKGNKSFFKLICN